MDDRLSSIPEIDAPETGYGQPGSAPGAPKPWLFVSIAAALACVIVFLSLYLAGTVVAERDETMRARLDERLTAETRNKLETINVWLEAVAGRGNRVLRSELIALFVRESWLAEDDPELARGLAEQRPYMRAVFDDLARDYDLRGVYLLDHQGGVLVQDRDAPLLSRKAQSRVEAMLQSTAMPALDVRIDERGTVLLDIVQPLQASAGVGGAEVEGGLLTTVVVNPSISSWLPLEGAWRQGESLHLWLPVADGWRVLSWLDDGLVVDEAGSPPESRQGFIEAEPGMFAVAIVDQSTGWVLEHRADAEPRLEPIREFEQASRMVALILALLLAAGTLALFWRQRAAHERRLIEQYRGFAGRIEAHANLLQSLLRSTDDWIWLRQPDGRVRFANRAFVDEAAALGGPEKALDQLMEPIEAAMPPHPVRLNTAKGERSFHVQQRQVPVAEQHRSADGQPSFASDLLVVARDMSEVVALQERRERLMDQTIDAFARAIELADPYLEGHTARLRQLCGRLAEELDLDETEQGTLARAAALSQIGKIFVPGKLLAKPGRHNAKEAAQMRSHIAHADTILSSIDFDRPVRETILQMNERLDGSGYPAGLSDGQILLTAEVLGVSDVFCARTRPRSYRGAKSPQEVCRILTDQSERYRPSIVAALTGLVERGELAALTDQGDGVADGETAAETAADIAE